MRLEEETPDMDQNKELEAIKARHEKCCFTVTKTEWSEREAFNAHTDRATLITLVEAERARAEKAEAELARVREAAGPFVEIAKELSKSLADKEINTMAWAVPRVGDFRALARAVKGEG